MNCGLRRRHLRRLPGQSPTRIRIKNNEPDHAPPKKQPRPFQERPKTILPKRFNRPVKTGFRRRLLHCHSSSILTQLFNPARRTQKIFRDKNSFSTRWCFRFFFHREPRVLFRQPSSHTRMLRMGKGDSHRRGHQASRVLR